MRHFDSPKFIYLWRKFLRKIGLLFPRGRVFKIRNIFSARFCGYFTIIFCNNMHGLNYWMQNHAEKYYGF